MKVQNNDVVIHESSEVLTTSVGAGTIIWQYVVILSGASIGADCKINCHVFIENDVVIGNSVTVKPGVHLWDGVQLGNDVFVGPSVAFTNDLYPRGNQAFTQLNTVVEEGASIGANATILAGVRIGAYSLVGCGSVVTRDVPAYAIVHGNPARVKGWIDQVGQKMVASGTNKFMDSAGNHYMVLDGMLMPDKNQEGEDAGAKL